MIRTTLVLLFQDEVQEVSIQFSPGEYAVLEHLLKRKHYLRREPLAQTYISRIRKKLDTALKISVIETIWGEGYRLRADCKLTLAQ